MSFIDLATLTMHRRAEMEGRINTFDEKCDRAISDIKKLKKQAHSFVSQLNCDPAELKERFLNFMKKLDEYTYLITDFNLALGQIEDLPSSEYTPVQDASVLSLPPLTSYPLNSNNLIDALSETTASAACACSNNCPPEKPKRVKVPKEEQVLIAFSSSSTSSESVPNRKSEMVAKEVQCTLAEEIATLTLAESPPPSPEALNLPQQDMLEAEREYHGVISSTAGACFWAITEDSQVLSDFMHDLTEYYRKNDCALTVEQARSTTHCAVYDEDSGFYYRALCIHDEVYNRKITHLENRIVSCNKEDRDRIRIFLVDTGDFRDVSADSLCALAPLFYHRPPYARYCHLAGLNLMDFSDKNLIQKYEDIIAEYLNTPCTFYVDENESDSVGVYVTLASGEMLNDIMVQHGLAVPIDKTPETEAEVPAHYAPAVASGPPEMLAPSRSSGLDLDAPEYEDPVEAVTGYHNRDEEDICKHYKGGPTKTCFKGSRCTKKHIMKHPDGWTLDRVEVMGKINAAPLPAPGKWIRVHVTAVAHYDHFYANLVDDGQQPEEKPEFGVVLPPMTLAALVRDMNSPATRSSYKPLQFAPAPGEMVAAAYPPDGHWYRACVLLSTRSDQSLQVRYIDYGTEMWIKEDQVRVLDPRFTLMPSQAIRCVLAGVFLPLNKPELLARAKEMLTHMIQDKTLHCRVIARDYDEITVELLDSDDSKVSEQLAARGLVELHQYSVTNDDKLTQKVVVR